MFVPLADAAVQTCGGKAAALGAMLRAGLPVPDGFVVPFGVYRAAVGELVQRRLVEDGPELVREAVEGQPLPRDVFEALERTLERLDDPVVAVRSSAAGEDTSEASAAGQHDSILGVQGITDVAEALRACWASLFSSRAMAYRRRWQDSRLGSGDLAMAVVVQHHLDAEVSGVMFTPPDQDGVTVLESAWGLGISIVSGMVMPDTYRVHADGSVTCSVADKATRLDRIGTQVLARDVAVEHRERATLDVATATKLTALGEQVAATLGGPQDIEWAVEDGRVWLLQARPVTAAPPPPAPSSAAASPAMLTGMPGSQGRATGAARSVRGPRDFARVRPGDILFCSFTDPAWTPLLRIVAGVVTETGGALSHAAIVARENGIPAVLGVPGAVDAVRDGVAVTIDGSTGTVITTIAGP